MRTYALSAGLAALIVAGAASAQTASPKDRDTTLQTGGPHGTSGAVGPNDNPDGSNKDAERWPAQRRSHNDRHHRATPHPATPANSPS